MNSKIMECDESKLKMLLAADEHTIEHDPWMQHVEHCSGCQLRLRELAADDGEWRMTASVLASDDDDVPCFTQDRETPSSWSESIVKQLLDPPSHPEMLGRLGRYEMERMIGSGGMGIVFKAFDTELNRVVAVKLLAPHLAARGSARKRFEREARAAAGVRDDHVVPIFNVESEHEPPFLVMQYVAGGSLQEKLDRDGPLEVAEVLRIGLQTAKGLAAAHAQGLIHRDVKPSNILLDEGVERAVLTDFGLARAEDDACLTRSGFHPGTPHYMSPEQVRGEAIDGRSDLFSLGCVLYALCTGRSPFRADTSYAVMRRITDEIPRSIRELNAEIPQWLESIVMTLLSKTREDRFRSADKVAELLEDCLAHVQEPTTTPLPPTVAELAKNSVSGDTGSKPTGRFGGFRFPPIRKLIAAAFSFFALAGTIIYLESGKGTLRIESQADDVPIRIVQGNDVVEELTISKSGRSVRIAAGTYEVEIGGEIDGLLLDKRKVVLSRGENEVVRIARNSRVAAQVSATPMEASVSFDAPFRCRVRWGEGIYENAFVRKGDFIAEVVEFDPVLFQRTENQLSAAKNQVNSIQAKVQEMERNMSAAETAVEAFERQRKAYEEVKGQIETAAAAATASAKNRIEAKKAELAEQRAVLEQNRTNLARQQELFEEALISRSKFQATEHEVKVVGARVKKAKADLQTAESDLIARQSDDQAKKEKALVDVDLAIASLTKAKGDAARVEGELAKARLDLKKAQKNVVELETKIARQRKLLIHAPFSGFVTQLVNRIVNEGDRICLLSPEAAVTQPEGRDNASSGAHRASDDVAISTLTGAPLAQITETLRAVFALGQHFQEIQTKRHAAVEGEESEQTIARLEEEKAAVRSERDMIVAILEAQLEAAEQRNESQRTVLESVRLGVEQGLLNPPKLPEAEWVVVMTAAEIRQLELLIQHCRSLGIDEVNASQDDKTFALSILKVRLEAEQKNHRFHKDRSKLAKRRFELGDGDLHDVQEAEQAEAEVVAEVRKLEVLIKAYQNEKPNSIGLPRSFKQDMPITATPTIEEATRQFNLQSATDRATLFDPPIGELSVQQMRDAFAKTADEYREIGEHAIANSLQRIAETGKLPSDAVSPVYASGPYGKDEDGKLTQKQIVPMLMLPDGRGGTRLVPLRSAELIYNKHGRSSKRYGDLFEESQQTKAGGNGEMTGIEDRTSAQNDSVSEELTNAGESLADRAPMAVAKEGRQVSSDAFPKELADRIVAATGSPTWKLHHVDKLPTVQVDDSLGYRITLRRTWEEYSSLPQQKEMLPDELGPFELKHEDWEFVLFPREQQDASRRSDASTPTASGSRLTQSSLAVPGSKILWKTASSPYHTQGVCMGEGHGFVWYSLGTLFGQETIREKLKLTGGDDRIDLLIAGAQIEDEGNITANSCQRLMERSGDEALGRIETAIERTQEPTALRRLIGSLAFIRTHAATKLLMRLHESDNKDTSAAADYALVHRPLRPAAKSAYLDMLLKHRHVDVACEGAVHFRWKEALPILINLTSHPESLRELSWTIPARRELEGNAIEYKLIGAQQTIIAARTDPNDVRDAWQTLADSDDFEAVVLIGIELATYTAKGPQKRINDFGFRVLLTRPRHELTAYLKGIGKAMPEENAKQVQQLLQQLKQSEQLERLQSHGILVTPGGIGGASHRYVVPSDFLGGYVIDDLLQYCVSFSPKSEIVFFGPVITDDQFRQFHLLLPESHVRRMAAVWLNIVATVSDDERERRILRVSDLGSPAREIGLQVDDVIVGIGPFRWPKSESRDAYNAAMLSQIPGQESKIVVDRDGKVLTFPVTWEESTAHRLLCGNGMPTTQREAIQSAKPDVDESSTTDNIQALTGKWQAAKDSHHLLDSKLVEAKQTGFAIAIDKQFGESYRKTSDTYENQYREFLEQKGHDSVASGTIQFDYGGESELMISRKDGDLYLWYGVVTGGNPRIFLRGGSDKTTVDSLAIQWTSSCSDSPLDLDTDYAMVVYQRPLPTNQKNRGD